jgi:hypothetical protein
MDTSIVEITSRKRKRNEEMEEVEETTFVVVSLVTMLLGVMSWYYDKYFVKEPVRNWELERRIFLNRLYRGTEADCIQQLRVSKGSFFKLCKNYFVILKKNRVHFYQNRKKNDNFENELLCNSLLFPNKEF